LDGSGWLVDPLSVQDIAAGMKKVLFDSELRAAMVAKGIERSKAFSWDQCAKQVLAVFDSLEHSSAQATAVVEESKR
jgi:alpha-1,3-rhamnosyl/mannosyltransferase